MIAQTKHHRALSLEDWPPLEAVEQSEAAQQIEALQQSSGEEE